VYVSGIPKAHIQPSDSLASSSSPVGHVPLARTVSEILTTPGWTTCGPPTSPSPPPATSLSNSSLLRLSQTARRHSDEDRSVSSSNDPLQLISPVARHYRVHPAAEAHYPSLGGSSGSDLPHTREFNPQPINARHSSLSSDPFLVPVSITAEMDRDRASAFDNEISAGAGRYSMRTRQPRQLKPYAFDRLQYNHQLKHHPDALVKFPGPLDPVGPSSSPPSSSGSSSGSGDNDCAQENPGGEPVQRSPRAKGKKRHRPNTEHRPRVPHTTHRTTSVAGPSTRSPFENRPTESHTAEDGHWVVSVSDMSHNGSPQASMPWYPDVFNDLSSGSGSDDMPINTVQDPPRVSDTPPPRVRRRRVII
jgi:hypothetical protein